MREDYEAKHHRLEKTHWFLTARRALVRRFLQPRARDERIIDIGCSSGLLLQELREDGFTDLTGVDVSESAIRECQRAGFTQAVLIDGERMPFADGTFAAAIASDVLEHIEDDRHALREWHRVIRPGGELILLVPAFPFLWSGHDVANKHFRRYRRRPLMALLLEAGFRLERVTYWNSLLFFPIALVRLVLRLWPAPETEPARDQLFEASALTNTLLRRSLGLESALIDHGNNLPIGVSLVIRARRT